jgi:hypothetical protein
MLNNIAQNALKQIKKEQGNKPAPAEKKTIVISKIAMAAVPGGDIGTLTGKTVAEINKEQGN